MNPQSIVVQKAPGRPEQLILLFHGVGGHPEGLVPLGQQLAAAFPRSTVASIAAPNPSGGGGEWFSVGGINEGNRVARVAAAMPGFVAEIRAWQQAADVTATVTALVGFSQGAIMALEAAVVAAPLAGRVIAFAGRFAQLPERAPAETTFHLLHGKEDPVIPYRHAVEGAQCLIDRGGDVTADVVPFAGHEINAELVELMLNRLSSHVPKRIWNEALAAGGELPGAA